MLFHTFKTQEERRQYGGSAFIELQFCDLPAGTATEDLLAIDHIQSWKNDSLYVYIDDSETFCRAYSCIFDCGTYHNGKTGVVDDCGINYYAPNLTGPLLEKLDKEKPEDYEVLAAWLTRSKARNGFYILGL